MTGVQEKSFHLLIVGAAVFLLFGIALEIISPFRMMDFKEVYWGARCAMVHQDPYKESSILAVYRSGGGTFPSNPAVANVLRETIAKCTNLPTTLFLAAPLARLQPRTAQVLWTAVICASFLLAAFAVWKAGAQFEPGISAVLVGLLLITSELLLIVGNTAGVVVSFCTIAVCCFLHERFVPIGIACLTLGLLVKPQDAGLVWLYFLLAGGAHRKRALWALGLVIAVSASAALWISRAAPDWPHDLLDLMRTATAHGGRDDPGPASSGGHGIGMIISLQAAISSFQDKPQVYNLLAYCISGSLLAIWVFRTIGRPHSESQAWFGIAAIAALSMLPVYHRTYDAKILLLAVPGCAIEWRKGGRSAWIALALTTAAVLLTGDLFWAVFLGVTGRYLSAASSALQQVMVRFEAVGAPLILLAVAVFYLWLYMRPFRSNGPQVEALEGSSS
jgi:hypothetical protein